MDIADINHRVIEQFRSGGEVDGMHRERLLLLTTTGRRSGRPYTTPMMFHPHEDRLLVIASNVGAPHHPDWYNNLVADPVVTVEVGHDTYQARATPATGAERESLWSDIKSHYPFFADHEAKTTRTLPVVILERVE